MPTGSDADQSPPVLEVEAVPLSPPAHAQTLERLHVLASLMDSRFKIPGTKIGVGLDSILGLLPVVGDAATAGPGVYLILRAKSLGVRKRTLLRMTKNLAVDLAVGSIPLVGDFFDLAFRSNLKNVRLIARDLEQGKT